MPNEAIMAQALRGSEYAGPKGGYFPNVPSYGLGAYGQPRPQSPGVIPQETLSQAMAPPPPQGGQQQQPPPAIPQPPPVQAPAPSAPNLPAVGAGAGGGSGNRNKINLY